MASPADCHDGNDSSSDSTRRSPRFTLWVAYLIFSIIATVSSFQAIEAQKNADAMMRKEKWAIVCTILTTIITALVVAAHMNSIASVLIVGTRLETVTVLILVIFWSVTVAIVTDPLNGLAVGESGEVVFGNLWYSSWAGFVISVMLLTSCLRTTFGVDVSGGFMARSARATHWSALFAFSVVVMGTSANIYDADCTIEGKNEVWCKRTALAVSLGTVGTLLSMIIVGLKILTQSPFVLEVSSSFILFVAWAIGIGFITSELGPGAPIGNLYHFSWFCFLCTFLIGSSCFEDYAAAKAMVEESQLNTAIEEQLSEF
mmetsp:Transcript_16360/g.35534  ORF Transcript_16360/g.35534 Transcript_16360/m.35534 type:complete len:316 (+) Transcript_16360:191-1138(+)